MIATIFQITFLSGNIFGQTLESKDNYFFSKTLDIEANSHYARIKVRLMLASKHIMAPKIIDILQKYMLISGVFNTQEEPDGNVDLVLSIGDSSFFGLSANFSSAHSGETLYEGFIKLSTQWLVIENNIIDFIEQAILAIDGESSLFGSAILYSQKSDNKRYSSIVLTDFLGKRRYRLIDDNRINIMPSWSNDGSKFLYTSISNRGTKVHIFDFKTLEISTIKSIFEGTLTGGFFTSDDKNIILTQSINGRPAIYLYDMERGRWKRLVTSLYIATNGSLHGNKLLFTSNRSQGVQVFLKNNYLVGDRQVRMTFFGGNNSEPQWSNRGNIFLYTSFYDDHFQIFLMNEDATGIKQLTKDSYNAEQGVWSADDRQVLYTFFGRGKSRLKFITLDGKFQRELTEGHDMPAESDPSWSKNFDWSLLTRIAD